MFCPRCGREIRNNQRFCINCGYDISEDLKLEKEKIKSESNYKSYYKTPIKKNFSIQDIRFDVITGFIFKIFLTFIVISAMIIGIKLIISHIPTDNLAIEKEKYEMYMAEPSTLPELTQPETLQDLVKNLKDVQNFLVLYLKYSDDSTENKSLIFDNYRKQILKIETFSNENLLKEDIKNSLPQTKKEFNKCAKHYNKVLAPVGFKITSDNTYAKYHLQEDYRFTYKKFGNLVTPDMKGYLYLRAKHNDGFLENGGYLATTPNKMNKRIADYEKFINDNKDFKALNEVKDYLFCYTFGYIFAEDRLEMKAIKRKTFKKWDKKFIKQHKNSKLNPIFSKMITSANGISTHQFENLYPYEYDEYLEAIRPLNGDLEDIFSDIRKALIKEISDISYKYIYNQTEGMWYEYSDDLKITKDTILLAPNNQNGFDVYNNKFKKTNHVLTIDSNTQVIIKRGQMLLYTPQYLQIVRVDYNYSGFSTKALTSKAIRQYFPDVLIINVDNIGVNPVQVTKTTETQSYMLISHTGSNFEGYVLNSDVPLLKGEISNIFTIDTTNTVNTEWVPTTEAGKHCYITFITKLPEQTEQNNNQEN